MRMRFHEFRITSTYKGDKCWRNCNIHNYNNHVITVFNTETKKKTRFDFWASIANPTVETERDLLGAFQCFLDDALAVMQTKDEWDFFDEFGYKASREAHEIYKACKRTEAKVKRVIGDEQRVCDLINEINA